MSSPANYVFIWFFVYFVFKYFVSWMIDAPLVDSMHIDDLALAGFYILIFCGASLMTYYGGLPYSESINIRIHLAPKINFELLSYGLLFSVIFLIVYTHGVSGFYNPYGNRLLLVKGGMAYLFILYQFTWNVYIILLLKNKQYGRLIVFGVLYSAIAFLTARASSQLVFFVVIILTLSIVNRQKVLKYFLLVPLFGIPYVIITGVHRSMSRGLGSDFADIYETSALIFEQSFLTGSLFKFLNRIDHLESLALLSNGLERGQLDYTYGSSMSMILIQWIPRGLWNDKPLTFSSEMTLAFRPDVYYSDASNNFTGIGELLINFGAPGIIVGGFLFGVAMLYAHVIWLNGKGSHSHAILLVVVIYPYLISGVLASFFNDGPLQTVLLNLVFVFLLFRISIDRNNVSRSIGNS